MDIFLGILVVLALVGALVALLAKARVLDPIIANFKARPVASSLLAAFCIAVGATKIIGIPTPSLTWSDGIKGTAWYSTETNIVTTVVTNDTAALPDGGRMVEWLKSDGNQYIKTEILSAAEKYIVMRSTMVLESVNGRQLTGFSANKNNYIGFYNQQAEISLKRSRDVLLGADITFCTKQTNSGIGGDVYENGELICSVYTSDYAGFDNSPFYIFKTSIYSIQFGCKFSTVRVKSFEVEIDDMLVGDFHPAIDGNGVPAMWDGVTSNYFYNAGYGTFDTGDYITNLVYETTVTTNITVTDTVNFAWERDYNSSVAVPDTAAIIGEYRPKGDTNAVWQSLFTSTLPAAHWSGTVDNATNYTYRITAETGQTVITTGITITEFVNDCTGLHMAWSADDERIVVGTDVFQVLYRERQIPSRTGYSAWRELARTTATEYHNAAFFRNRDIQIKVQVIKAGATIND